MKNGQHFSCNLRGLCDLERLFEQMCVYPAITPILIQSRSLIAFEGNAPNIQHSSTGCYYCKRDFPHPFTCLKIYFITFGKC